MTRLFLSSTVDDLSEHRRVVLHVCQRLGIELIAMEAFGPDSRPAAAVCREKVRQADLFLGLYAERYGFTPEEFDGKSMTHLEDALCEVTMGKAIALSESPLCFEQAFSIAQYLLWQGRWKPAADLARRYTASRHSTERISMILVLAEAGMNAGEMAGMPALLANILREARAKNLVEPELRGLRCLAELHRRLRQYEQSRTFLEDLAEPAARGPYRLIQAEAALVLAELERDSGNYKAATAAAMAAREHAWCDGPPYAYHWALERANRLFAELSGYLS